MIYQKQKFLHDPDNGVYGDCHRTAIACILDLPRDDVPHFAEMSGMNDADEFHRLVNEWLLSRGLRAVRIPYDCELKDVLNMMEIVNPNIHYLLGGMSRNKVPHSVVCCGGGIVWDTSLDASGIVGPIDDCYWVTFFTPDSKDLLSPTWLMASRADEAKCTVLSPGEIKMYNRPLTDTEINAHGEVTGIWNRALTNEEIDLVHRGYSIPGNILEDR